MTRKLQRRSGVILLVVISMLLLFSGIALVFVLYSQAQASTARMFRETETQRRPDADPELLMNYFLGQLIYGTNNPDSPLRGSANTLAENMYGAPGGTAPYDANRGGVPYTYPDQQNMYLAAIKAGPLEFPDPVTGTRTTYQGTDGAVLAQSYHRRGPNGQMLSARAQGLPPMENPGGDVKNLHFSPGTYVSGTQPPQFASNDSIWLDLGHPTLVAPDGRRYAPLFAPLITDLDNKLNVNVHGNINARADGHNHLGTEPYNGRCVSHQGFGPWEVNHERVLKATDGNYGNSPLMEARRLLIGDLNSGGGFTIQGRYEVRASNNGWNWPWGNWWNELDGRYAIRGPFYSPSDGDAARPRNNSMRFPGFVTLLGSQVPSYNCFPHYSDDYDGWINSNGGRNHPVKYNFFAPQTSYYNDGRGRNYEAWEMDALLRYGDMGSPSLPSRLFRLCPRSFADPKTRRMVTTHSFDMDRPSVTAQLLPPGRELYRVNINRDLPQGCMGNYHQLNRWGFHTDSGTYPDLAWRQFTDPVNPTQSARLTTGRFNTWDSGRFIMAQTARQTYAQELFEVLWLAGGHPDPATTPTTDPAFDKLRSLAQLAVNIVDFVDIDDYNTPFAWYKPNPADQTSWQWVYGTELPRIVLNEVYAEVANDPVDRTNPRATVDYRVCFWIELNNPMYSSTLGGQQNAMRLTEDGKGRLRVPQANDPWKQDYAPYQIVVSKNDPTLNTPTNTKGEPDAAQIETTLSEWEWETTDPMGMPWEPQLVTMGRTYSPWQDEINVVRPMDRFPRGLSEDHYGYYVVGPKDDFPGSDANRPKATMRVKEDLAAKKGLVYRYPRNQDPALIGNQTILLRRLCCPAMPPDPNPASPTYNPYITHDYIEGVKVMDGVAVDNAGQHKTRVDEAKRYSTGRNQPYAAHRSQLIPQKPAQPPANQPNNTMFEVNVQVVAPMDPMTGESPGKELTNPPNTPPPGGRLQGFPNEWLCFLDRPVISPVELMLVSQYKPHELTQKFVQGPNDPNNGAPSQRQKHLTNWYDPNLNLYRAFEFVSAGSPQQWVPVGGRAIGRININTVWDREIFHALTDPQPGNFFYDAALTNVDRMFDKVMAHRSPQLAPGPTDQPFLAIGGHPNIENTLFKADPYDNQMVPAHEKRRLFEPEQIDPNAGFNRHHPYVKQELLRKVFNNLTTRSNVFGVWLTVGFFEVQADGPPRQFGPEMGRLEGRHIRHRMFAVLDRSSLTVACTVNAATTALQPQLGQAGPQPVIVPTHDQIFPGNRRIKIPRTSMLNFEGADWALRINDFMLIDPGPNQEIVRVTDVQGDNIVARFIKPHPANCALIKVHDSQGIPAGLPGNPGPQPRFDARNPVYQGVVRYFSVVE